MEHAEVMLWGTRVGVVMQPDSSSLPIFSYDPQFVKRGIEISPIVMPLSNNNYIFPTLQHESFYGLPGMFVDSLPDMYGNKLIDRYLSKQGRTIADMTAIERLLYTGKRGMGALEYYPPDERELNEDSSIDIYALVKLASDILNDREEIHFSENEKLMKQILDVGDSAGGARAKAVIAWNPKTKDIRSGQINAGKGYTYWIIKFDEIPDKTERKNTKKKAEYTRVEYAYYLMAKDAGIIMNECKLYKESGLYHFMTKRFDRTDNNEKLHKLSLGGLAHFDFKIPGSYSYEQVANIIYRLNLGHDSIKQLYRRMVFNYIARNQDDHAKNTSFLMDKDGNWTLAPAYDITYAYSPTSPWISRHQTLINGKNENITYKDLIESAITMNISKNNAKRIIDEVDNSINKWDYFAETSFVSEETMLTIKNKFNINH